MDYDSVIKLGMLLLGGVGATKILYEFSIGMHGRRRDDFRFAREFLSAVEAQPTLHPYALEKGYQALVGDSNVKTHEIAYLLTLRNPTRAVRDYVLGRSYLEHLPKHGDLEIAFKKKYQSRLARGWRLSGYFILYMTCAVLTIMGISYAPQLIKLADSTADGAMLLGTSVVFFASMGWLSLKAGVRIARAAALVKDQGKHTQRIFIAK